MTRDTSKFAQLEKEISEYKKLMSQASDTIINERISDYPIFVIHQQEIEIGIVLAEKGQSKGNWSINASTLEEFISKQIIQKIKLDSFKTVYKNPKTHLCLFVLSELGANFVFIPKK